jgi:hypothetical protein
MLDCMHASSLATDWWSIDFPIMLKYVDVYGVISDLRVFSHALRQ